MVMCDRLLLVIKELVFDTRWLRLPSGIPGKSFRELSRLRFRKTLTPTTNQHAADSDNVLYSIRH